MRILLFAFLFVFSSNITFAQYAEEGEASYYNDNLQGKSTASGEPYNAQIFTAAHKTHPFGTKVIVTNTTNGKSVIVRINDRGPFIEGRIIDLSRAAAQHINLIQAGHAPVKLRVMDETTIISSSPTGTPPPTTVITTPTTTTTTSVPPMNTTTTVPPIEVPLETGPPVTTSTSTLPSNIVSTPYSSGSARTPIINSKTITANFAVQLGSYRDFSNVGIELEKYKGYSFTDELKIYETWSKGKKLFKLLVGPFATREEAAGRMKNIKDAYGLDCFIFAVR